MISTSSPFNSGIVMYSWEWYLKNKFKMTNLNEDTLRILLVLSALPNHPYTRISMWLYCCCLQFKHLNIHLSFPCKPAAFLMVLIWFIVSLCTKLLSSEKWLFLMIFLSPHSIGCQILSVVPLSWFSCLSFFICLSG